MTQDPAETFKRDDLIPRLIDEFGYNLIEASSIAARLASSTPPIKEAFWHWWQTGDSTTAPEVEGFTIDKFVTELNMKVPGAFTSLDWLLQEPKNALRWFNRRSTT